MRVTKCMDWIYRIVVGTSVIWVVWQLVKAGMEGDFIQRWEAIEVLQSDGTSGYLCYGPYLSLNKGLYEVSMDIQVMDSEMENRVLEHPCIGKIFLYRDIPCVLTQLNTLLQPLTGHFFPHNGPHQHQIVSKFI